MKWRHHHCIALHKRYYKLFKKSLPKAKLQSHIAKMKKRCYKQWELVNSMAAQEITDRIYAGYDRFFTKDAKHPPIFKNWRKYKSVTFKSSGWTLNGNVLTINKLKLRLKFHLSRSIDGKIQTVCVKRDAVGDWWLSFSIRKEDNLKQIKPMTGKTAGFDFGLKHFLTGNDGQKIDSPQYLFHAIGELRRKSRNLSKKVKGNMLGIFFRGLFQSIKQTAFKVGKMHWHISHRSFPGGIYFLHFLLTSYVAFPKTGNL